jgi:ATP-binding cassette subfamily F protein uup
MGASGRFADYSQWDRWQKARKQSIAAEFRRKDYAIPRPAKRTAKRKLSYLEAREFATLEQRITDAEQVLARKRSTFEDPAIAYDAPRLMAAEAEMIAAQQLVDQLYARWAELEPEGG